MSRKLLLSVRLFAVIVYIFTLCIICQGNRHVYSIETMSNNTYTETLSEIKPIDTFRASLNTMPEESIKIEELKIFFQDKELCGYGQLYALNNRYFIPLEQILSLPDIRLSIESNSILISTPDTEISIDGQNMTFLSDNQTLNLTKPLYSLNNTIYINLFDACNILNLRTRWDLSSNTIFVFKNYSIPVKDTPQDTSLKPALIRLEDIAPDPRQSAGDLEKLRIIADYLYSEGVKFHVAWVPRYVNPQLGTDNEPASTYSMYNADFVFMLDYLINKNGIIGLHGYTHQYSDSESIDGIEFHTTYKNDTIPDTEEYAADRINRAIESAKKLDIPFHFFEAPHYAATPKQFKVMESFFDILYEPYSPDGFNEINTNIYTVQNDNKTTIYVPTPLQYLDGGKDLNNMLDRIKNLNIENLASFFYHPYLEYDFIELKEAQYDYSGYLYSHDSYLHKIIEVLNNGGYEFISVKELYTN